MTFVDFFFFKLRSLSTNSKAWGSQRTQETDKLLRYSTGALRSVGKGQLKQGSGWTEWKALPARGSGRGPCCVTHCGSSQGMWKRMNETHVGVVWGCCPQSRTGGTDRGAGVGGAGCRDGPGMWRAKGCGDHGSAHPPPLQPSLRPPMSWGPVSTHARRGRPRAWQLPRGQGRRGRPA